MVPGRYARVRSQIWQRVIGRRVTVTGQRRERGILITFIHAGAAGSGRSRAQSDLIGAHEPISIEAVLSAPNTSAATTYRTGHAT